MWGGLFMGFVFVCCRIKWSLGCHISGPMAWKMPPASKSWLFSLVNAERFCSWKVPLCHILKGSCMALFTMKNSKMLQGESLKKHLEREASFQILHDFWSLLRVAVRVVHEEVLRITASASTGAQNSPKKAEHTGSFKNSFYCFILCEVVYEIVHIENRDFQVPLSCTAGLRQAWVAWDLV